MFLNYKIIQPIRYILVLFIMITCILLTTVLDLAEANLRSSSFYFSESFLFSSFWWLFMPLLYLQFTRLKHFNSSVKKILLVVFPALIHFFVYPLLIWVISNLFYEHTFAYVQTLTYELTTYSFILIIVYALPISLFIFLNNQAQNKTVMPVPGNMENLPETVTGFLVADGSKKMRIAANEILYFSANPPYINIHTSNKRFLYKETLKSISEKLDQQLFVRIHKSHIVQIKEVQTYSSRSNGDYDIILQNGISLRLSRNFAAAFTQKYKNTQDTTN